MIPTIYKNIISEKERNILKNQALHMFDQNMMRPNSNNRYAISFKHQNFLTKKHQEIYQKIVEILQLNDPIIDPFLGIIISLIKPGGAIHPHVDSYENASLYDSNYSKYIGCKNLRFNLMVERDDDDSYCPIIDGRLYQVERCDGWCFIASHLLHSTSVLSGTNPRIVYQFGFLLNAE